MLQFRFPLIFIFLGMGAGFHYYFGIEVAWMFYAAASILLLTHLLFGNVWQAFRYLQRGQPARAQRLLDRVRFPQWLVKRNRAYYHLAQGLLRLHTKQPETLAEGAQHLQQALGIGLYRANDRALAHLNLAHVAFVAQDFEAAATEHSRALAEQPTDLLLREKLKELGQALAKHNQGSGGAL